VFLDHISIQCADFDASAKFYDAVCEALGVGRAFDFSGGEHGPKFIGYGVTDPFPMPQLWIEAQQDGDGFRQTHIALVAKDQAAVDAFYQAAVSQGAEVLHEPRRWPEYEAPGTIYYAAFVRDPDGNNIEAVQHGMA